MNYSETSDIRKRIRALWEHGLDTVDMSRELQVPQCDVERHLHVALDRRRAVVRNLGKVG